MLEYRKSGFHIRNNETIRHFVILSEAKNLRFKVLRLRLRMTFKIIGKTDGVMCTPVSEVIIK